MVCITLAIILKKYTCAVYAIREAAVGITGALSEKFGTEWMKQRILPRLQELSKDSNYLHRLTCLFCINVSVYRGIYSLSFSLAHAGVGQEL